MKNNALVSKPYFAVFGALGPHLHFLVAFLKSRPLLAFGYAYVALTIFVTIFAPYIAPYDPVLAMPNNHLQAPSSTYLLGTDEAGMDILSRIMHSPRIDLTIALLGTGISAILGSFIGALVGFYQGRSLVRNAISSAIMRAADVIQSFPVFVFAIALVAIFGQSISSIIAAIAFVNTPIYLRLMRTQVLTVQSMRYVEASYISGSSDLRIIVRHIIPNSMGPVLAHLSVNIGWSILLTAALSFVGAGIEAPTPEWGSMIAIGFKNIVTGEWWCSVFPGIALALTVFSFALIGASIEILADPQRRKAIVGSLK